MSLRTEPFFCRTHFDDYFSSSSLELQTEMKIKLLPSFVTYLTTYLNTCWLEYFIRALARTILSKFSGLKYHTCLSNSSLCNTTWDKKSCHACGKSML